MSETLDNLKTNLVNGLKTAFEDIVRDVLAGAKGDVKAYGQQLAQEYGRYLWKAYAKDDVIAKENLKDLKAQVLQIGVRRAIIATNDTWERVKTITEIAAQIGLKAFVAAAVAL